MASQLEALVKRVAELSPKLADDIATQLRHAERDKSFGLVFNRHMPEMVELYGRSVRRGDKVRVIGEQPLYTVTKVHGRGADRAAHLVPVAGGDPRDALTADLVVVADFDDPIYPGLRSTGRIERGGDMPFHMVINAENYHALSALQFTHTEKVDCIYIDPPYNTGGDLTYNDKRVAREDANRHSKWLSFMERRLKLAKELLNPTGVIIVAIDDNEHAYLKLLMDRIFGESNFIANLVWSGGRINNSNFVSNGNDYMLIYARDVSSLTASGADWREPKPGADVALAAAAKAWEASGHDPSKATELYRESLSKFKGTVDSGVYAYNSIDENGDLYHKDNISAPGGSGGRYPLLHPKTNEPCKLPSRGWAHTREAMDALLDANLIVFGEDHTTVPGFKRLLKNTSTQLPDTSFKLDRRASSKSLTALLGDKRFDYPKDTTVLARWIGIVTGNKPDAVILDFFGGSGSTMHAVMDMNAADGGRRQCILVTNNEVNAATEKALTKAGHRKGTPEWDAQGIHARVTRPRIETVVTGVREDGSQYSDGMAENVEFFDFTYEDAERVRLDMAYEAVSPLLWLRAGGAGERISKPATDAGYTITDTYAVLFNPDIWKPFTTALRNTDVRCVYIVTDIDAVFDSVRNRLSSGVDAVRLYEDFLSTFKFTTGS